MSANATQSASPVILSMRGITKRYPGVIALSDVSLDLRRGEVLAVMGENGAGKSTLMKILSGAVMPDMGTIEVDGKPVALQSIAHATLLGIALVHQELMLANNLDIAANIFLAAGSRLAAPMPARIKSPRCTLCPATSTSVMATRPVH